MRSSPPMALSLALGPLVLGSIVACGSSHRMVHESHVYFERCHTADFDPSLTSDQRHECWAKWVEHYTVGQPPERVDYAHTRLHALERGEDLAPLPGLEPVGSAQAVSILPAAETPAETTEGADGTGLEPDQEATVRQETTVHQETTASATTTQRLNPPSSAPANPCTRVCDPRWNSCVARCRAGGPDGCIQACRTEHTHCMGGCY